MIKGRVSGTVIILLSQPTFQLNRHCQIKLSLSSQGRFVADFLEKQRSAGAEIAVSNWTRAPFLSGFGRLLRCGKDLRQFAEVLGGCGEEEFVICAIWAA